MNSHKCFAKLATLILMLAVYSQARGMMARSPADSSLEYLDEISTRYGVVVTGKSEYGEPKHIYINKKQLPISDIYVSIAKKWEIGEKDVLLISTSPGGNICAGYYVFLIVTEKQSVVTEPFGNCFIPVVSRDNDRILVKFPGDVSTLSQTIIYENGKGLYNDRTHKESEFNNAMDIGDDSGNQSLASVNTQTTLSSKQETKLKKNIWNHYTAFHNGGYIPDRPDYEAAELVSSGFVGSDKAHLVLFNNLIYVFYIEDGSGMLMQNVNLYWRGKEYRHLIDQILVEVSFREGG